MSDYGGPAGDDDVGLPKATVFKLIQEMLPPDIACSKEAKDIIVECCVEWVKLISTQSNTICDESSKKTISPEHVVEALRQLGFEAFIPEVEESNKEFKQSQKARPGPPPSFIQYTRLERTRNQPDTAGMSQEELLAMQERLFAASQARFEAGQ